MDLGTLEKSIDKHGHALAEFVRKNDERLKLIEEGKHAPVDLVETVKSISELLTKTEKEIKDIHTAINRTPILGVDGKTALTPEQKISNAAFYNYLRKGIEVNELKALVSSNDPAAGYLINEQMGEMWDLTVRELSPFRQVARVINLTKGNRLTWAINKKGGVGFKWEDEQTPTTETGTPTFGQRSVPIHLASALSLVTPEMLEDSEQNIDNILSQEAAEDFTAGTNLAFFSGNGINKPTGFLTLDPGTGERQIEQINSGNGTTFTRDGIVRLQGALKSFYRNGSVFMASRTSITDIRLLKDLEGRYSLINDFTAAPETRLLGTPLIEATDMPDVGAGKLALAYGNFNFGYHIVDRKAIMLQRFIEKFEPFIGFKFKQRVGGDVRREEAIKLQIIAA